MFFVLSGFLITLQLQREPGLQQFYLRRSLRILPTAYLYLAVVTLLGQVSTADLAAAASFTINFYADRSQLVSHFWSLAMEEQFYLLWPLALARLPRVERLLWVIIAVSPVVRIGLAAHVPDSYRYIYWFPFNADSFACGCLLACQRERIWSVPFYRWLASPRWSGPFAALLIASIAWQGRPRIYNLVLATVQNLGIVCVLDGVMRYPECSFARLLNQRHISRVGQWSYSLYVWQQLFVNRYTGWWVTAFPLSILLTLAAGWLSFRFVEQPLHRLGQRFTRAKLYLRAA